MKLIKPIALIACLILSLTPFKSFNQNLSMDIVNTGEEFEQFNFEYSGECRIKYFEFNEYIVRVEDNIIQLFDENLKEFDKIEIPRASDKSDIIINITESKLYVTEILREGYRKIEGANIFEVDLFDLSNYRPVFFETASEFDKISIIPLKDKAYISISEKGYLKDFQKIEPNGIKSIDLDPFLNEHTEGGDWQIPFVYKDQVIINASKVTTKVNAIQSVFFDDNMNVTDEVTQLVDLETGQMTKLDANGEVISENSMNDTFINPEAFPIVVNNKTIWVKTVFDFSGLLPKHETWVSYDQFKFDINLSQHLKKEMAKAGIKKSTGMSPPIIYKDPVNGSIILQFWKMVVVNGIAFENFFYFNLNSRFFLRNAYKVKLTRYPLADLISSQFAATVNQHTGAVKSFTFEMDNAAKRWEGDAVDNANNAFDYLFSLGRAEGLCTVLDAKNMQYLFIDQKDGITKGHVFKRAE